MYGVHFSASFLFRKSHVLRVLAILLFARYPLESFMVKKEGKQISFLAQLYQS